MVGGRLDACSEMLGKRIKYYLILAYFSSENLLSEFRPVNPRPEQVKCVGGLS